MTAINTLANATGAYMMTDTACYDSTLGYVTSFPSKVSTFPHLSLAIATTGSIENCEYLASQMRQFSSYDDVKSGLSDMIREAWDNGALDVGDDRFSHVRLLVAGWCKTGRCGEIHAVSTKEEAIAPSAFALVKAAVLSSPGAMPADILTSKGYLKPNGSLSVSDPAKFLTDTIKYQRRQPWPVPGRSDQTRYIVGGSAVLTTVNAGGITQRVVHHWNDCIGEMIDPNEPVADTAGLSRLQRERMEKKLRKGTMRAA